MSKAVGNFSMKRTFGLTIAVFTLALNLLAPQTIALYQACCIERTCSLCPNEQPACQHCQYESTNDGIVVSQACCLPLHTHSTPKFNVPVPVQTHPDAHFMVAVLPMPVLPVVAVVDRGQWKFFDGTSPPALSEILTLHSRLNI